MSTIKKTTKEDDQLVKETYQDIRVQELGRLNAGTALEVFRLDSISPM